MAPNGRGESVPRLGCLSVQRERLTNVDSCGNVPTHCSDEVDREPAGTQAFRHIRTSPP